MAAGMEVQQRQSQLFTTLNLIEERFAGFFQRLSNRMAEVNQIAVVWEDLAGP